jgi:hypothetical protein
VLLSGTKKREWFLIFQKSRWLVVSHALCKGKTYDGFLLTGGFRGILPGRRDPPPIHLRLWLVVRSHEVITRGPAEWPASHSLASILYDRPPGMVLCSVDILYISRRIHTLIVLLVCLL